MKYLHVQVWGEGERVVLIHGSNTEDAEFIWSQQRELAKQYQLIVPERRGYGKSPTREQQWKFEDDTQDMIALLGGGAHLVGLSSGGLIALLIAAQRPELVYSLTVIEPPVFGIAKDRPEVAKVIEAMKPVYMSSSTPETFIVGFMKALDQEIPEPVSLSSQHRKGIEATMGEPEPWEVTLPLENLAACSFPKLVVSGDWHPAFIITADILAQRLHAERLIIKGAGHGAQGTGKPFNDRLEALIKSAQEMRGKTNYEPGNSDRD
ncbi:MAG: alpha/beta fold hydrolase [Ktedonobacteraceae bacterium]